MADIRDVRVEISDGVVLVATVYLPERVPQPCLLEALPYRKDDVTCDRDEYLTFCDTYGYAVCRLDLRGTGSSQGRAVDEYPVREQDDLVEVIAWLGRQPWCDGTVGMYGTSYSGFNSLQTAMRRPPELKAVVAIYATDDRYTDDVQYCGGSRRLIDLVDYCHYMTPLNALPPVPAVFGYGWREEWLARLEEYEPWLLTWLAHPRADDYWRHGSLRPDYASISCPTMLVGGWADGYRNNTWRTLGALTGAGTPARLLVGPWAHADPATSAPGPRIDLLCEMAAWFDQWLRNGPRSADPPVTWFVRHSHRPAADLDTVPGHWRSDTWPPTGASTLALRLDERPPYAVRADVGVAAWNSCAGHLPWGQPTDQRYDDAASLTWDWPAEEVELAGYGMVRLRLSVDAPASGVAVRLCDVHRDGTSTLVSRGWLALSRRSGLSGSEPTIPGETYDVTVDLEACAHRFSPGHLLRLAVAGADFPNTLVPPGPSTLTIHSGQLELPITTAESPWPAPTFPAGAEHSGESADGVIWRIEHDVLAATTACVVDHGSSYATPYGHCTEHYDGRVSVDLATHDQTATATATYTLRFDDPPIEVRTHATLDFRAGPAVFDVTITLTAEENGREVGRRTWERSYPRDGT
ncbi:MAG: CocE/NonD family hydrolase [Geodermatophilaceae bacterium]|nr:CocE/NonD family hydrolase [Geodermatophilaceae bacterium]